MCRFGVDGGEHKKSACDKDYEKRCKADIFGVQVIDGIGDWHMSRRNWSKDENLRRVLRDTPLAMFPRAVKHERLSHNGE